MAGRIQSYKVVGSAKTQPRPFLIIPRPFVIPSRPLPVHLLYNHAIFSSARMIEISVTSEVSVGVSVVDPLVGVAVAAPLLGVAEVLAVGHGDLLRLVADEADGAADVGGDGGLEAALAEEAVDRLDLVPA